MSHPCSQARSLLHGTLIAGDEPAEATALASAEAHLALCAECRHYLRRETRLVQALSGLQRLAAPAELEQRLALELESLPKSIALLGTLERWSAPEVLDRLVAEELANPAAARAARFAGSLGRLQAPSQLAGRLHRSLTRNEGGSGPRRLVLLASGLVAAASLLFVLIPRLGGSGAPEYPFEVVRATSLDELDPLARALLNGLAGGVLEEAR